MAYSPSRLEFAAGPVSLPPPKNFAASPFRAPPAQELADGISDALRPTASRMLMNCPKEFAPSRSI